MDIEYNKRIHKKYKGTGSYKRIMEEGNVASIWVNINEFECHIDPISETNDEDQPTIEIRSYLDSKPFFSRDVYRFDLRSKTVVKDELVEDSIITTQETIRVDSLVRWLNEIIEDEKPIVSGEEEMSDGTEQIYVGRTELAETLLKKLDEWEKE